MCKWTSGCVAKRQTKTLFRHGGSQSTCPTLKIHRTNNPSPSPRTNLSTKKRKKFTSKLHIGMAIRIFDRSVTNVTSLKHLLLCSVDEQQFIPVMIYAPDVLTNVIPLKQMIVTGML
jgi:hypothetical protein